MNDRIKESDWKIFKVLRPLVLQRYCERVLGGCGSDYKRSELEEVARNIDQEQIVLDEELFSYFQKIMDDHE